MQALHLTSVAFEKSGRCFEPAVLLSPRISRISKRVRLPLQENFGVFCPAHAPREREALPQWWDAQAEWSQPHPYNDPAFRTPSLRAWFMNSLSVTKS